MIFLIDFEIFLTEKYMNFCFVQKAAKICI